MDMAFTEEQRMIVDMVRRFVREEIIPLEDNLDPDADELPSEKLSELVEKTKEESSMRQECWIKYKQLKKKME